MIDIRRVMIGSMVGTLIVMILVMGVGCATKQVDTIVDVPAFHPPLPLPLAGPVVEFKVLTPGTVPELKGQYTYMALSWEDYLILGQFMEQIAKKFNEYKVLVCYYREDLGEVYCDNKGADSGK